MPSISRLVPLLATVAFTAAAQPLAVRAAGGVPPALIRAIRDTNTVRTLTYTQTETASSATFGFQLADRGLEDEVGNREQDHESATIHQSGGPGAPKNLHYTIDVIFIKGQTYYRASFYKNDAWQQHPGTTLTDPYTGSGWRRARTTVTLPTGATYTVIAGEGLFHVRVQGRFGGVPGTADIYASRDKVPYVVREVISTNQKVQGKTVRIIQDVRYGPFNRSLSIQIPAQSA